jgi:hypothetical protein
MPIYGSLPELSLTKGRFVNSNALCCSQVSHNAEQVVQALPFAKGDQA